MIEDKFTYRYEVDGTDFSTAGEASSDFKKLLTKLGVASNVIRRVAIAMYEAEINMVIHANGGVIDTEITLDNIKVTLTDNGPGIPDIELAMQAGYSTATEKVRELGFGAGMGLPNIKNYTDVLNVKSEVGKGTTVEFIVNIK